MHAPMSMIWSYRGFEVFAPLSPGKREMQTTIGMRPLLQDEIANQQSEERQL